VVVPGANVMVRLSGLHAVWSLPAVACRSRASSRVTDNGVADGPDSRSVSVASVDPLLPSWTEASPMVTTGRASSSTRVRVERDAVGEVVQPVQLPRPP
jgi:hypothetical protein